MKGELLAEIRKDHHNTQQDLADQLHISVATVRSWEREQSSPSHDMLAQICRLYNVSSDYLLGLTRNDHLDSFSREELAQLREFEAFLLWKRHQK